MDMEWSNVYAGGANENMQVLAPYDDDDVQLLKILGIALKLCLLGDSVALVSPKKQRESCKSKRSAKQF